MWSTFATNSFALNFFSLSPNYPLQSNHGLPNGEFVLVLTSFIPTGSYSRKCISLSPESAPAPFTVLGHPSVGFWSLGYCRMVSVCRGEQAVFLLITWCLLLYSLSTSMVIITLYLLPGDYLYILIYLYLCLYLYLYLISRYK